MKLSETILLSLTICFMVIGIHQSMNHGFANSYWIFMLMLSTLIIYQMRKNKRTEKEEALGATIIPEVNNLKAKKRKRSR